MVADLNTTILTNSISSGENSISSGFAPIQDEAAAREVLKAAGAEGLGKKLVDSFLGANLQGSGLAQNTLQNTFACISEYAQGLGMDALGIDLGGIMSNLFGGMDKQEIVAQMGTSGMGNMLGQVGLGNLSSQLTPGGPGSTA